MADSPQTMRWAQHEDCAPVFTMDANGSIAGHTYSFTVKDPEGVLIFRKTGASITITNAGSATTPGVVTVTITEADTALTIPDSYYDWELWRTNVGIEARLGYGPLEVGKQLNRP